VCQGGILSHTLQTTFCFHSPHNYTGFDMAMNGKGILMCPPGWSCNRQRLQWHTDQKSPERKFQLNKSFFNDKKYMIMLLDKLSLLITKTMPCFCILFDSLSMSKMRSCVEFVLDPCRNETEKGWISYN
jgi:hypothetical protein